MPAVAVLFCGERCMAISLIFRTSCLCVELADLYRQYVLRARVVLGVFMQRGNVENDNFFVAFEKPR